MTSADVAPQTGKGRGAIKATAAIEAMSARALAHLAARPGLAALALIALVLALDLAGNIVLPPLDRTEVIYAQTAKQMLEPGGPGNWTAPAFQAEAKFEKPLAVLWLQAGGAWLSGEVDQIRGYRVASILATILAVLITFLGARRIFDPRVAGVGAALLATMLVVTLQATLAMPEALMLAATCAALFAMGRAYSARQAGDVGPGNALIFWLALGVGVLVNVMTIPLIASATALALVAWDRGTAGWLKRLRSWPGMAAFVVLAALWPLVLWQAGTFDAAVAQWRAEGLHLLLGPQEMKWRVLPGLFALFLLLGMFPAGLFLAPSLITAWRNRASPAIRFLIAWIVPYLLFLELFTRKTPLYMVQAMLPPVAVLFALWVMRWKEEGAAAPASAPASAPAPASVVGAPVSASELVGGSGGASNAGDRDHETIHLRAWFRIGTYGWLALVIGLVIALWVLPFVVKMWVTPLGVVLGLITVALAMLATKAMLTGQRLAAATSLIAMAIAFNNLTIPVTFAGLRPVWVSSEIRTAVDALRPCRPGPVIVAGHNEPSAVFELGTRTVRTDDGGQAARNIVAADGRAVSVIDAFQADAFSKTIPAASPICVAAYDFIKGCSHRFKIGAVPLLKEEVIRASGCLSSLPARFRCENVPEKPMIGRMCK